MLIIQFNLQKRIPSRMKKILISCDCNGHLQFLLQKVKQLHEKNAFDFMLMLGNICTIHSSTFIHKIVTGQFIIPLPIYFIDHSEMATVFHKLYPKGHTIAPNFHFLGISGIANIQNVQIAFISGSEHQTNVALNDQDIQDLRLKCIMHENIDIFLTNQWTMEMKIAADKENVVVSKKISELISLACPQYHLAASSQQFFRLASYKNSKNRATNFISVAPILNEQPKDKYLFAIQLTPLTEKHEHQEAILANPYEKSKQNSTEIKGESKKYIIKASKDQDKSSIIDQDTYVYFEGFPLQTPNADISQFLERWGEIKKIQIYQKSKGNHRSGIVKFGSLENTKNCIADSKKYTLYQARIKFYPRNIEQKYRHSDCWFCMSKQNFDKSLVIFEGKYCYVSLQKGPVCYFHLQIVPYNHVESTGRLEGVQIEEVQMIKSRFLSYFSSQNKTVIIYERYIPLSEEINHCIVHLIPVDSASKFLFKFKTINQEDKLYFHVWATGNLRKLDHFIHISIDHHQFLKEIHRKDRLQPDFMRKVICEILGKPNLIFWKDCIRKPEEIEKEKQQIQMIIQEIGLK